MTVPPDYHHPVLDFHDLETLAALKSELETTLKGLEAIEKEGLPSSIGSQQDAEALERGLTEALEQVRAAKKKL